MKILLVQPPKPDGAVGGEDFHIFEPLALEYVAAAADDHDVLILDMRLDPDLQSLLRDFHPHVVGLTSYTVHVNTVKRLAQSVKEFDSSIVTIVGGHHATVMTEDFFTPFIDVVVTGQGLVAFRDIIERLDEGLDLKGITGTAPDKGRPIVAGGKTDDIALDDLPLPRRDLTARYRPSYFTEWMKPLASIRTSQGCLFRCSFCALWKMTQGRYITRKPERIVEELKTIAEKYVFFADDESLLDPRRMDALADLIGEAGVEKRYFFYARSDTVVKHPALLTKWKTIGLERVFVGLESMRDQDLKLIRKATSVENNQKAVEILRGLDIDIFPTFIVRPDFERRDFEELRECALKLDLSFIGFSVLTPLPGTDFYNEVKDSLVTHNYDYFDFFHPLTPTKLPIKDFYSELAALYKRSRSRKNQLKLLRKYPLRQLPALFRAFGNFFRRLETLKEDYPE